MLSERFKYLTATIRFRLMVWMILVVIVLVAVAMLGVRQIYRARLLDDFDKRLRANVKLIGDEIRQLDPDPDWPLLEKKINRIVSGHPFQSWFAEVYDAFGRKLAGATHTPTEIRPFSDPKTSQPLNELPYRLLIARLDEPGLPPLYVRIGADRQSYEDDVRLLDETMLVRSLIIVLLAPVGGYVIALRATRPIARIIVAAARLQPSQLDERLPIRGTGDELDQLSRTINGMLDRIADYIDRNRAFVAHAAHELRSPLAAIRSSVEVTLNRQRTPEEYANLLGEVMEECQYLSNLVNRLLILAEGDAGRLGARGQTTRLDRIVRESLDMFEAVAEAHNVRLSAPDLPCVLVPGDEFYLRQVVRNLLDNAVKFSAPGRQVSVGLRVDPENNRAVLTVQDQGAGIPEQDVPHIFERFYRGDKARQREPGRGGSGLGLSICQSIVLALGGSIAVISQVGQGSTFTVTLPVCAGQ